MGYIMGFVFTVIVMFSVAVCYYAYTVERDAKVYCASKGLDYLGMGRNIHAWVCLDPKTGTLTR